MELLATFLGTILTSYVMDLITSLQLYKDMADLGYKINTTSASKTVSNMSEEDRSINNRDKLIHLIPVFNIFYSMMKGMNYLNTRGEVINRMYYNDMLEEMSEKEKQEYQKRPNGLNALFITTKTSYKLAHSNKISIETGLYRGDIYYTASEDLEEINIIKVTGSLSRLTEEEQKEKVREVMFAFAESVMKDFFSTVDFEELLKESDTVIVQKVMTDGTVEEMSNEEKKKILSDFKKELLGEQEEPKEELENKEEGPKLTKRK